MSTLILHNQTTIADMGDDGNNYRGSVVLGRLHEGYLAYMLYVVPEHRRMGVGTRLLREAALFAAGKPLHVAPESFSDSPLTSDELAAWYFRLGFQVVNDKQLVLDTSHLAKSKD